MLLWFLQSHKLQHKFVLCIFAPSADQYSNGIQVCRFLLENASHIKLCGKHRYNGVSVLTMPLEMWQYSDHYNMRITIIYIGIKK